MEPFLARPKRRRRPLRAARPTAATPGRPTGRRLSRVAALLALLLPSPLAADPPAPPEGAIRIAVFNTALARRAAGQLVQEFRTGGSPQIDAVVEIVQRVRPDILLALEVDHDARGNAPRLLAEALRSGRGGAEPIHYPHIFAAPVNTGVLSGFDLDRDGKIARPGDAEGWGYYEGQFGMALLSRWPIRGARAFQRLPWSAMPDALLPAGRYPPEAEPRLRLSSKSHWDVLVETPRGPLHVLASHPTPPVFDGPQDENGRRNADEIRFWTDYLSGRGWMIDDAGRAGGAAAAPFVLLGDLNADPADGDGRREAIRALLAHPALVDPRPASEGGREAADADHEGDPSLDTAAFGRDPGPGSIRVDYALPSAALEILRAGVFWPPPGDPLRRLVGDGEELVSSDHRLVWIDVRRP